MSQIVVVLGVSADLSLQQLIVILFFKTRPPIDFGYLCESLALYFLDPIAPGGLGRVRSRLLQMAGFPFELLVLIFLHVLAKIENAEFVSPGLAAPSIFQFWARILLHVFRIKVR